MRDWQGCSSSLWRHSGLEQDQEHTLLYRCGVSVKDAWRYSALMRGEIDRAAPTVMPADSCGSSGQKVVPNDLFSSPSLNKIDGIGGLTGFTVRLMGTEAAYDYLRYKWIGLLGGLRVRSSALCCGHRFCYGRNRLAGCDPYQCNADCYWWVYKNRSDQ